MPRFEPCQVSSDEHNAAPSLVTGRVSVRVERGVHSISPVFPPTISIDCIRSERFNARLQICEQTEGWALTALHRSPRTHLWSEAAKSTLYSSRPSLSARSLSRSRQYSMTQMLEFRSATFLPAVSIGLQHGCCPFHLSAYRRDHPLHCGFPCPIFKALLGYLHDLNDSACPISTVLFVPKLSLPHPRGLD